MQYAITTGLGDIQISGVNADLLPEPQHDGAR
jgi:hypothetical protein